MRAFIRNCIQAEKVRREEQGDKGFSLIELIIVVVILGILAAIAIPIFLNIQDDAKQKSADAIAANGATQAATQIAQGETVDLKNLEWDGIAAGESVAYNDYPPAGGDADSIEGICVTVVKEGKTGEAGPGCANKPTP